MARCVQFFVEIWIVSVLMRLFIRLFTIGVLFHKFDVDISFFDEPGLALALYAPERA